MKNCFVYEHEMSRCGIYSNNLLRLQLGAEAISSGRELEDEILSNLLNVDQTPVCV